MPAGHTAQDLRDMGLPQPGELYREEQPDGTILIRQHSPVRDREEGRQPKNNSSATVCQNDRPDIA